MGSGIRRMVINDRERAVSTDINRLQAFLANASAEMLRYMLDVRTTDSYSGGTENVGASTTNPLRAVVLSGVRARPEIGTVNCFVEPGVIAVVNPDATPSPDDSPLKLIRTAGVISSGTLTLTTGSGDTRVDVIECSRNPTTEEQANRDIYNTTTGKFDANLVDKVETDELTFRIRTGVSGGGFPGTASGWFPIAVAVVPSSAASWDDVDVYDVRRLASDFTRTPFAVDEPWPVGGRQYAVCDTDDTYFYLAGCVDTSLDGMRIGGEFGADSITRGVGYLRLDQIEERSYSTVNGALSYIYALWPEGLPRWAKYTDSTHGSRVPGPFRGIPILSATACDASGRPSSAIYRGDLPFTATTYGRCISVQPVSALGALIPWTMVDGWVSRCAVNVNSIAPSSGGGTDTAAYTLTIDTIIPKIATAAKLAFTWYIDPTAEGVVYWYVTMPSSGTIPLSYEMSSRYCTASGENYTYICEVPVRCSKPMGDVPSSYTVTCRALIAGTFSAGSQHVEVYGLRLML